MENYFRVDPPSACQMVLAAEANGIIERCLGRGRSLWLLLARENLQFGVITDASSAQGVTAAVAPRKRVRLVLIRKKLRPEVHAPQRTNAKLCALSANFGRFSPKLWKSHEREPLGREKREAIETGRGLRGYASRSRPLRDASAWIPPRLEMPEGSLSKSVRAGSEFVGFIEGTGDEWCRRRGRRGDEAAGCDTGGMLHPVAEPA